MSSKLEKVLTALGARKDVVVTDTIIQNYGLRLRGGTGWAETVEVIVGLKRAEFDADKLQELLEGLVPDLKPSAQDKFDSSDEYLNFGKLYFDEVVGTAEIVVDYTIADALFQERSEADGPTVHVTDTQELKRRTWLLLYPSVHLACDAKKRDLEYRASREELARYK